MSFFFECLLNKLLVGTFDVREKACKLSTILINELLESLMNVVGGRFAWGRRRTIFDELWRQFLFQVCEVDRQWTVWDQLFPIFIRGLGRKGDCRCHRLRQRALSAELGGVPLGSSYVDVTAISIVAIVIVGSEGSVEGVVEGQVEIGLYVASLARGVLWESYQRGRVLSSPWLLSLRNQLFVDCRNIFIGHLQQSLIGQPFVRFELGCAWALRLLQGWNIEQMLFGQWWFGLAGLRLNSIHRASSEAWRSYNAPIRPKLDLLQRDGLLIGLCQRYCIIATLLHLKLGGAIDRFRLVVSHLSCAALVIVVLNRWDRELALLLESAFLRRDRVVEATDSRPQIYFLNWLSLELLFTGFPLFRSSWRWNIRDSWLNFGGQGRIVLAHLWCIKLLLQGGMTLRLDHWTTCGHNVRVAASGGLARCIEFLFGSAASLDQILTTAILFSTLLHWKCKLL